YQTLEHSFLYAFYHSGNNIRPCVRKSLEAVADDYYRGDLSYEKPRDIDGFNAIAVSLPVSPQLLLIADCRHISGCLAERQIPAWLRCPGRESPNSPMPAPATQSYRTSGGC